LGGNANGVIYRQLNTTTLVVGSYTVNVSAAAVVSDPYPVFD
jgi:hypothetical protein